MDKDFYPFLVPAPLPSYRGKGLQEHLLSCSLLKSAPSFQSALLYSLTDARVQELENFLPLQYVELQSQGAELQGGAVCVDVESWFVFISFLNFSCCQKWHFSCDWTSENTLQPCCDRSA